MYGEGGVPIYPGGKRVKQQEGECMIELLSHEKRNKEELAKEVLAEVPTQLLEYMEAMKIQPGNKEIVDYNTLLSFKHQNSLNDNNPGLIIFDPNDAQGLNRASTLQDTIKQGGYARDTGTIGEFGR